jgi:hypothetical protein
LLPPALSSSPNSNLHLKYQHFQLITEIKGAVTWELINVIKESCLAGIKNCLNMQINAWIGGKKMIFFQTCIFAFFTIFVLKCFRHSLCMLCFFYYLEKCVSDLSAMISYSGRNIMQ